MGGREKHLYEFGPYLLDAEQEQLFRDGQHVPLPPKVFDTLRVLVEHGGRLLRKEELMGLVWPDTFVEEANLAQNVSTLRKVLGAGRRGREYIETVPRKGYRFAASVRRVSPEELPARVAQLDGAAETEGPEVVVVQRTRTRVVEREVVTEGDGAAHAPPNAEARRAFRREVDLAHRLPSAPRTSVFGRVALVIALLSVVAVGFVAFRFVRPARDPVATRPALMSPAPASIELKRLTSDGRAFDPTVSPDGEQVAYRFRDSAADGGAESVRLLHIASGSTVEVLPRRGVDWYGGLSFSPDGSYLYFTTRREGERNSVIARAPVLGGTVQEVARDTWSAFTISPDGRQLAFVRGYKSAQGASLIVADVEGDGERELLKGAPGRLWFAMWSSAPAWSPDGRKVVVGAWARGERENYATLLEVNVSDGATREIAPARWFAVSQVAWLKDGTGLLAVAQESQAAPFQIWHVAYPSGDVRRVTSDLNDYGQLSLSADSRLLVAQQEMSLSHLWVVPGGDTSRARQLTFGTSVSDGYMGLAWTPDGRLLFASNRGGALDLWTLEAGGGEPRRLTNDTGGANWSPRTTPDGRYVVFVSTRAGRQNIWRMDADGSNPFRLTSGVTDGRPSVSPDGRWVFYTNEEVSPSAIERVSIDGGEVSRVPSSYAVGALAVSPDGRWLAYAHYDEERGWMTGVLPASGGEVVRLFGWHGFRGLTRWTPDSRALLFIENRHPVANLFRQPLAGGEPARVTSFKEDRVMNFDLSPDGRTLALARGNHYSDVVLITNFR